MSKELIVSSTPHETKVAILDDDQVVEVYFEREQEYSLAGSIHKGRVTRVLPGMQSAFVNIGLDRDAFLYVSDFFEDTEEYDALVSASEDSVAKMLREGTLESPEAPAAAPGLASASASASASAAVGAADSPVLAPAAEMPLRPQHRDRGHEKGSDRKGRNRRRRGRNRGGFPESKYAGGGGPRPLPSGESAGEAEAVQPAEAGAESPADPRISSSEVSHEAPAIPIVLPGESLAKYRNSPPATRASEPEPLPVPETDPKAEAVAVVASQPEAQPPVEEPTERVPPIEFTPEAPLVETGIDDVQSMEEDLIEEEGDAGVDAEVEAQGEAEVNEGGPDLPADATATVRGPAPERKFSHQQGRRMRRRGRDRNDRGSDRGSDRNPAPASEAGSVAVSQPQGRTEQSSRPTRGQPLIGELLKEGQEIIVQIAKEPIGKKGARITSHIALPGRYLVYMPTVDHVGVSRRISSDEERQRLKRVLTEYRRSVNMPGGFIVRTAAEGHSEEDLRADMRFLFNLWKGCRDTAEKKSAPALLHRDLNLVERILRDQISSGFTSIWVDSETEYSKIVEFVELSQPSLAGRVKLYTKDTPIFEEFGVQEQINNAMKSKVWLKSGGYIVINQTEALVAIDVNTGKYVGKTQRLEDTIVKTNVDAVKEIVRQVRLRDLGGIIVIDFIDMDERKNRTRVMQALEEALRQDRAPSKALAFNDFGLVAITRKRVKQPLEKALGCACPYCQGSGFVKNLQTVSLEILAEAKKMHAQLDRGTLTLRVNPDVAKYLKSPGITIVAEIEEMAKRPVLVKGDVNLHQENFDIH